jgi:hypothetical protein
MRTIIDVKIRDISANGALLRMPSNVKLPEKFSLLVVSEGTLYQARKRWRKASDWSFNLWGAESHCTAQGKYFVSAKPFIFLTMRISKTKILGECCVPPNFSNFSIIAMRYTRY